MNCRELRIGNLIYEIDKFKGTDIVPVIGLNENDFNLLEHSGRIKPILLTNDTLIRLGFKDLGYGEFELGNYMCDGEYTDHNEYEFCYLGKRLCTVYFVHQLQNLYFALTGEELTYA